MKIVDVVCSAGRTGFYFDDQRAIKAGAGHDGIFYVGQPVTEGFSAVLSALCLFAPFEEFVNSNFSIPTLVYYLTVTVLFLFFTVQELEKRRWN